MLMYIPSSFNSGCLYEWPANCAQAILAITSTAHIQHASKKQSWWQSFCQINRRNPWNALSSMLSIASCGFELSGAQPSEQISALKLLFAKINLKSSTTLVLLCNVVNESHEFLVSWKRSKERSRYISLRQLRICFQLKTKIRKQPHHSSVSVINNTPSLPSKQRNTTSHNLHPYLSYACCASSALLWATSYQRIMAIHTVSSTFRTTITFPFTRTLQTTYFLPYTTLHTSIKT